MRYKHYFMQIGFTLTARPASRKQKQVTKTRNRDLLHSKYLRPAPQAPPDSHGRPARQTKGAHRGSGYIVPSSATTWPTRSSGSLTSMPS